MGLRKATLSELRALLLPHLSSLVSAGAMVLGKPQMPGRSNNFNNSMARAYCACSRCGLGFVWTFFLFRLSFLSSFSLSLGDGLV